MSHSFLLEPEIWKIQGYYIQPNSQPIAIEGNIQISWKEQNWFKMSLEIASDIENNITISCRYRGNLARQEKHYTYVAQHSLLGNIEGEGRLGFKSIVQHHWSIGMAKKRRGFETFYVLDENTYFYTSSILENHNFNNIIEATLER